MPAQVRERTLVDLFLDGGPDFRHLIVPAFSSVEGSYGQLYWQHRQRSHSLEAFGQTAEQRWNDDYYHITVGQENKNWANNLVDPGDLNSGIEFGILKSAGWLIDMFRAGNVALVFNAYGTTNRAHDLSRLVVKQGNVLATPNERLYSGWGGRLARSANSNCVSLISSPSIFAFGPTGSPNDYDPAVIDNVDVLAIGNSRELGLFDEPFEDQQHRIFNQKMARASKQYYAGIKQETVSPLYAKFFQHEENLRSFGDLLRDRLESVPIPPEIEALYSSANFYQDGTPNLNPDPEIIYQILAYSLISVLSPVFYQWTTVAGIHILISGLH